MRLSLQALETLAVIAYKPPVTVPVISDIRGVDSSAVIGTLLERKLITTAGRKAVVGRPMLYKTSKDFLLRFGLNDLGELPSLEEFEKLAASALQDEAEAEAEHVDAAVADATGVPDENGGFEPTVAVSFEDENRAEEPAGDDDPHHHTASEHAAEEIASKHNGD